VIFPVTEEKDFLERRHKRKVTAVVVIAYNEALPAIQAVPQGREVFVRGLEINVSKMVHMISRFDTGVPLMDHGLVHFLDVFEPVAPEASALLVLEAKDV
jgi:hypothetical protein